MLQESAHVICVDIEPSYEEMSVGFVTRKLETGIMQVVLALIISIDTWLCTTLLHQAYAG